MQFFMDFTQIRNIRTQCQLGTEGLNELATMEFFSLKVKKFIDLRKKMILNN